MTDTHTPGPWSLTNGNLIRVHQRGTGICVAGIHRIGKARDCPASDAVPLANARLISAAPDLLATLIAVRARFQHYRHGPDEEMVMDRVNEAIRKARAEP